MATEPSIPGQLKKILKSSRCSIRDRFAALRRLRKEFKIPMTLLASLLTDKRTPPKLMPELLAAYEACRAARARKRQPPPTSISSVLGSR
jgi:hypothetical protein